jgi:hypothetical protein
MRRLTALLVLAGLMAAPAHAAAGASPSGTPQAKAVQIHLGRAARDSFQPGYGHREA